MRAIAVSCAERPLLSRAEVLLHGRLSSLEGAGADVARNFVQSDKIKDVVAVELELVAQLDGLPRELLNCVLGFSKRWI